MAHPLPMERVKWMHADYIPPWSALNDCQQICNLNNSTLDLNDIAHLLDLAIESRTLYSSLFIKGRGLVEGKDVVRPDGFRLRLADPHSLLGQLYDPNRSLYSILEDGFLICASVVCQSRQGGGSLFFSVTGRKRDGITHHTNILQWLPTFPL